MWSDRESESDFLNFGEVSQLAVDILKTEDMLPVSIGVFGNWGAGKSSLLKFIERDLATDEEQRLVIKFDAWLYQGYDDARASILEVIAAQLIVAAESDRDLLDKAKGLLARVDYVRALGWAAEGTALAFGIPASGLLSRGLAAAASLGDGVQAGEYAAASDAFTDIKREGSALFNPEQPQTPPQQIDAFRKEYSEVLRALNKQVIVSIDNLDRCLPKNAIQTLEAIRLFLFLPNTAFIIAADEEMIRSAVSEYFRGSSDRHQIDYLDKLIQVPIRVPKAGLREIRSYLFLLFSIQHGVSGEELENLRAGLERSLQASWKEDPIPKAEALKLTGQSEDSDLASAFDLADRIAPILATSPIIHGNPRIVKRLMNVVRMRTKIAQRRGMPFDESLVTKMVIFERCAGAEATSDLYRRIDDEQGQPQIIVELEDSQHDAEVKNMPESWSKNQSTANFIRQWAKLEPSLKNVDLRAAIYLSRETMPIGSYVIGLSPTGREALDVLSRCSEISSPTAALTAKNVPLEEQALVIEALVEQFRKVQDWASRPSGFAGACLLARNSPQAATILKRYFKDFREPHPWLMRALENEPWYGT